ncbi:MAG TPA: VOC family protein [Mycobacteriales bacterium]|nr:VOC family protein [Mycobacteriales bacterium]
MTRPAHALYEQPWPDGEYRFFQMGYVVGDLLSAAATWARVFGIGPFHVLPIAEQTGTYRGQPAACSMQVAAAQAGPVQIELIQQHCDRPSIYREWRRGNVSGLHQLCSITWDYDGKKEHYGGLGYDLLAESDNGRFRVAYYDTVADFGFVTEIVEAVPRFLEQIAAVSRTCAEWDGTDPVRILTRDGYRVPGA